MIKVEKKWGQEEILHNDRHCVKVMTVFPGHSCSLHFHRVKEETFYIISGELHLTIIDPAVGIEEVLMLKKGDHYTIKPGMPHKFRSFKENENCIFLESSTHDDPKDSYRITPSY